MSQTHELADLAARAPFAERAGRSAEANRLWDELLRRAPEHPQALWRKGRMLIEARNPKAACEVLEKAAAADPKDPEIPLTRAFALRQMGNLPEALKAVSAALAIDPYHFAGQLSKGSILEQMEGPRRAARAYTDAIKLAPAPERLPPVVAAALQRAKDVVAQNARDLEDYLRQRTSHIRGSFPREDLSRFDESLSIYAGRAKCYVHEGTLLNFPKLPALTFYDRKYFPWLEELEAQTETFRRELEVVLREDWDEFKPYVYVPPGGPVNQWGPLNNSPRWSTLFLWKDSRRIDDVCRRCPGSAAALERLPMASQPGFAPTAMFSVLQPKTTIPAHTGSTNVRLVCHLPLILPENCRFRVGNDMREWKMGEAFVFDDSIEHEAWNDSDKVRVVLIFDVWNPLLTEAERALVSAMMEARNEFYRAEAGSPSAG